MKQKHHSKHNSSISKQELFSKQTPIFIQNSTQAQSPSQSQEKSPKQKCTSSFPKFSLAEFNEAVKRNIMHLDNQTTIFVNPEKYNIFFCDFDFDSPIMKETLFNLKLEKEQCQIQSYDHFKDETVPEVYCVINYLTYLKSKYIILKAVIKERNRIKSAQREAINRFSRSLPFQFLKPKSIALPFKIESNSNLFITSAKNSSLVEKEKFQIFKSKSKRLESSTFNQSFQTRKPKGHQQMHSYQLTQTEKLTKLKQNSEREKRVADNLYGILSEFESAQQSFYKEMISDEEDSHIKQRNAIFLQKKVKASKFIDKINETMNRIQIHQHLKLENDMQRFEKMKQDSLEHISRKQKWLSSQLKKIKYLNFQRDKKQKTINEQQETQTKIMDQSIPEQMDFFDFQESQFQQIIQEENQKKVDKIQKHYLHSEKVREKFKNNCQEKQTLTIGKIFKKYGENTQKETTINQIFQQAKKKRKEHFQKNQLNKQIMQQKLENNMSQYKQNLKQWEEQKVLKNQKQKNPKKSNNQKFEENFENAQNQKFQQFQIKSIINQQKIEEKKLLEQELIDEALKLRHENNAYRRDQYKKLFQ